MLGTSTHRQRSSSDDSLSLSSNHDAYSLAIMSIEEKTRLSATGSRHSQPQQRRTPPSMALSEAAGAATAATAGMTTTTTNTEKPPLPPIPTADKSRPQRTITKATSFGSESINSNNSNSLHRAVYNSPGADEHRKSSSIDLRKQPTPALLMPVLGVEEPQQNEDGSHHTRNNKSQRNKNRSLMIGNEDRNNDGNRGNANHQKQQQNNADDIDDDDEGTTASSNRNSCCSNLFGLRCVQWLCLRPNATLQTQLMLSFGTVHVLSTLFVVGTCIFMVFVIGHNVKEINSDTFAALGRNIQGRSARYLAESLEHRLYPKDIVELQYQTILDRFEGYDASEAGSGADSQNEGTTTDVYVPFMDMTTNTNRYPIDGPALNLDWDFSSDSTILVSAENAEEHLQQRHWLYGPLVSTSSAAFVIQGACDPSETDPTSVVYLPNCTAANNDIETGGKIAPTTHAKHLHRKGKDLVPLMKALYEYNQDIREIGVYFANEGAGATINFPQYPLNANVKYKSISCDWLDQPNPYDPTRTIGKGSGGYDLSKYCHEAGTELSVRNDYNPIERAWYRNIALDPENIIVDGPYLDAWTPNFWLLSLGRAVYDRRTKDFIGTTYMSLSIEFLEDILKDARLTPNSEVSITRWNADGTVVASSAWSLRTSKATRSIWDIDVGVTSAFYQQLFTMVNYDDTWDPASIQERYETTIDQTSNYSISAYPVPPVPDTYDPNYHPEYFAIISTGNQDVLQPVEELNDEIDDNFIHLTIFASSVGAGSIVLAAIVILLVARAVTAPLQEMNRTADNIVSSFGEDRNNDTTTVNNNDSNKKDHNNTSRAMTEESDMPTDSKSTFQQINTTKTNSFCKQPVTEITMVVKEFNQMVSTFSGSLMAHSEKNILTEAPNRFFMREQFISLYESKSTSPTEISYDFKHPGRNVIVNGDHTTTDHSTSNNSDDQINKTLDATPAISSAGEHRAKQWSSPLFLWIVALIITPLLLTTVTISVIV
eukprot:CAMPEP_0119566856 /NCGR_PEP_ID=MMETSP1352-20130426/34263_1 /TAXON_ID=265584 /ORGANISM="Stauroneis constricta, Strain CCMP1120" /LENGTH=994 /DNA_ID=CAMNT_0007616033 /DNA_START=222 /DNA_END=3202 /DNA_ORIENTATION=+